MTSCSNCNKECFIPTGSLCLPCSMKQKKTADIQKTKAEAIAAYNEKVEGVNF